MHKNMGVKRGVENMKIIFRNLGLAIMLILVTSNVFSNGSSQSNNANTETVPPDDIAVTSVLENALVKYTAIAMIKNNDVYFRIYRGIRNGRIDLGNSNYLKEQKISILRNDSDEDHLLTLQLRLQYPTIPRNANVNITNPNKTYRYSRPQIVYNYKTGTFLVLCVQTSQEYGQQVVGRLFKFSDLGNNNYKIDFLYDEFRILNKVRLLKRNNSFIVNRETVSNVDVDTGDKYAILAITKPGAAEVRLIYMNCKFANYLYSNFYVEPREAIENGFLNATAAIEAVPNSTKNKIYILYAKRDSGFILDIIDNDFTNFYNRRIQYEIPLQSGYRLSGEDKPKITAVPYVDAERYGFRNDANRPHKLLILYAYQYIEVNNESRDGIILYDVYNEIPIVDVCPRNFGDCIKRYKPMLETNGYLCFLTFKTTCKINLSGRDIYFNYIFGKKIDLYNMYGYRNEEMSDCFLISGGRPMKRENLGISATGVSYYAGEGWVGFREMPIGPLISVKPDYLRFTGRVSQDNRSIDFVWRYYPSSYRIYIIRPDGGIEYIRNEGDNFSWVGNNNTELSNNPACVILNYKGMVRNVNNGLFMPQVSDPLMFSVSPASTYLPDDYYGNCIAELVGIDY